jgi:hypothetical protein
MSYKISHSYATHIRPADASLLPKFNGAARGFDMRAWEARRAEQGRPLTTVSNHRPRGKQKIGALT